MERRRTERRQTGRGREREREREGGGERRSAELAERLPGDAYRSYLAKCIKTNRPVVPRNIELTEPYDSSRAARIRSIPRTSLGHGCDEVLVAALRSRWSRYKHSRGLSPFLPLFLPLERWETPRNSPSLSLSFSVGRLVNIRSGNERVAYSREQEGEMESRGNRTRAAEAAPVAQVGPPTSFPDMLK